MIERKSDPSISREPAPRLSVLVPVFNAERYLRECLDSLVGQTLGELEIICIDDGSTDSSRRIIQEYAERDGRVVVIDKANSGYGDSMNRGLEIARGKWIGICEPDDFCDRHMFRKLVRAAERWDCDLAKSNYSEHAEGRRRDGVVGLYDPFPYRRPFSPREEPRVLLTAPTIWAAVYRRSMLVENGIRFSTTPGASYQDASFGHQCWICARRVVLLRQGLYHYRIDNEASSSKSSDKVFAVNGEYERSLAFLEGRGVDDLRLFGPWLNVMRCGVYVWNYNRIADEHHVRFVERWVREIVQADDEGLIDPSLFTKEYRQLMGEMLDDPHGFCAKYAERLPILPIM